MQISLNGNPYQLKENTTLIMLIEQLDLTNKRLAVEVNKEIVPRSQFGSYILTQNQQVEIVHAIGGG